MLSEIELIKIKRLCINNIELIDATTIQFIQLKILKFHFTWRYSNSNDKMNIASFYLLNIKDKMLLMGDATKNESKLMKIYQLPKLILKVGHHGSKTSSSQSFINLIKPTISIISSGKTINITYLIEKRYKR